MRDIEQIRFALSPSPSRPDIPVWSVVAFGTYSTAEGFRLLQKDTLSEHGNHLFVSFSHGRDFWRVKIQPRRLLLSRIIHNVIHVFSVLRRHHLPVQGGCLFCDHEDETMDHVLLHCPYAKAIWFASRFGFLVNCGRFPSVRSWILYWCNRWRRDEAFVQDVWISVICTLNALWFFRNSCRWGRSRVQPSVSQVNRLSLRFSYDSDFSASAEPILQLGSTSLG